jgi:catechol 2,3-dioxygenase-like lactoylglutathione lyase family enzyme
MIPIVKIGHATFETPDLGRQVAYYTEVLGLALVERTAERAVLVCPSDHQSVVLKPGAAARCVALTLDVAQGHSGAEIVKDLAKAGLTGRLRSDSELGAGAVVGVDGPDGLTIDIAAARPSSGAKPSTGIMPRKLGHVAFKVPDVQKTVDFYVNVFGFRVSDWMGDFFAFLRCGPDHHTVNLLRGDKPKIHHIAFEAENWDHVRRACDFLAAHKMPIIWGPGRHGIGHNIFIYHRNPDGQIVELYTELDQMLSEELGYFDPRPWHGDNPQRPKVWDPALPSNVWGPPVPDGFRD